MSPRPERPALPGSPPALYDQALALLSTFPDGIPPRGRLTLRPGPALAGRAPAGRAPENPPPAGPAATSAGQVREAVQEALTPLLPNTAATLHRRFARLGVLHRRHALRVHAAVAALPLPPPGSEERDAARLLARQLTRTGTTVPTVTAGIVLLIRLGEPEDIPYLSALGVLTEFTRPAVSALDALDRRAAAALWLAVHARAAELRPIVHTLWTKGAGDTGNTRNTRNTENAGNQEAIRAALVRLTGPAGATARPRTTRLLNSSVARRIAEAARLPGLLDRYPADPALLAGAAKLLARTVSARDDQIDLFAYGEAIGLYERVVTRAHLLAPTLDHHATLLTLAQELSSGPSVLLKWPPGRREELLATLDHVLAPPEHPPGAPAQDSPGRLAPTPDDRLPRRRAAWLHRTTPQRPFTSTTPATSTTPSSTTPSSTTTPFTRLRIEVVVADPADPQPVETRILLDGRPLVPGHFGHGPAEPPEVLLDEGRLRAGPVPHEVRLATASCAEPCCGALYVTIRRDGDEVVWENWRRPYALPGTQGPVPELPAHRFDAAAYDAEVARAETDRPWSWPARTTARLIRAGLRERPDLLARWGARAGWAGTDFRDPDTAVITFLHTPARTAETPEPHPVQHLWHLPDNGTPPESQAAAALHRLTEQDPRTY
ncbi:hypothetical protein AB0O07_18375 [Streptomyces sp. NPDC093085]|uniref:hypothetical protein n=1 Tax=Streptomyces sp. NPDC093085 TaxID=3155068 RepID=UPI00344599C9